MLEPSFFTLIYELCNPFMLQEWHQNLLLVSLLRGLMAFPWCMLGPPPTYFAGLLPRLTDKLFPFISFHFLLTVIMSACEYFKVLKVLKMHIQYMLKNHIYLTSKSKKVRTSQRNWLVTFYHGSKLIVFLINYVFIDK